MKTKGWTKLVLRLTHSVSSKRWFPADVIDLTKEKDDDLEKAIALSLQEAQVHQLWVDNLSAKSWNVVFHFKSLHWALFWHRKRNTYSSLFVKTRGIKIIHLYLHVLQGSKLRPIQSYLRLNFFYLQLNFSYLRLGFALTDMK